MALNTNIRIRRVDAFAVSVRGVYSAAEAWDVALRAGYSPRTALHMGDDVYIVSVGGA